MQTAMFKLADIYLTISAHRQGSALVMRQQYRQRCRVTPLRSGRQPADLRTERAELFLDALVTAIDVVDAVDAVVAS